MHSNRWSKRLVPAVALVALLACNSGDLFVAQATLTPTRTPRPTMTALPPVTNTVPATRPSTAPTGVSPVATKRPTLVVATSRPATPRPPIVIPTEAAALKYEFAFIPATCSSPDPEGPCNLQNGIRCHHSGSKHIRVTVYDSYYDPYSQRVGGKVRFSHAPDGAPIEPDETTQSNGVAEKTLSSDSDGPDMNNGTYYAWVVDTNGNRISEMSGAVTLNGKSAEESGMCTIADVFFAGGKK